MEFDDETVGDDAPKADEEERRELVLHRRSLLKRVGLGAAALTIPSAVVASPTFGAVTEAVAADSFIKSHPNWKFVFVNHVTTNPFFVPTIYGAQDACSLLGCSYQWTGSTTSDISQMVNAFNSAISAKASGISCCLVDLKAFNGPTANATPRASRCSPTTPTCLRGTRTSGSRTSARICTPPGTRWASGSSTSSAVVTSRCSSPPPAS